MNTTSALTLCALSLLLGILIGSAICNRTCRDDQVWENFDIICDRLERLEQFQPMPLTEI
jgi:hypothetical protein